MEPRTLHGLEMANEGLVDFSGGPTHPLFSYPPGEEGFAARFLLDRDLYLADLLAKEGCR